MLNLDRINIIAHIPTRSAFKISYAREDAPRRVTGAGIGFHETNTMVLIMRVAGMVFYF